MIKNCLVFSILTENIYLPSSPHQEKTFTIELNHEKLGELHFTGDSPENYSLTIKENIYMHPKGIAEWTKALVKKRYLTLYNTEREYLITIPPKFYEKSE